MDNIFNTDKLYRILLFSLLISFTMTYAIPLRDLPVNIDDAVRIGILEKAVEKLIKLKKKGTADKILDAMLVVKSEIENMTGSTIEISRYLEVINQEIKKKGYKLDKKQAEYIKKKISSREKKRKNHAEFIAQIGELNNEQNNYYLFEMKHHKSDSQEEDKEEIVVPVQLVYGVSITLCGLFLYMVPIPAVKPWGVKLMEAGILICGDCIVDAEQNKKDQEKKNK